MDRDRDLFFLGESERRVAYLGRDLRDLVTRYVTNHVVLVGQRIHGWMMGFGQVDLSISRLRRVTFEYDWILGME